MKTAEASPGVKTASTIIVWGMVQPPIWYAAITGTLPSWCRCWFAALALIWAVVVLVRAGKAAGR